MATKVRMQRDTGLIKYGFYGYSWTTFFFGPWPALFRGDFKTFLSVVLVVAVISLIFSVIDHIIGFIASFIAMFIWSFMYNKYYTRSLLEKGYKFADTDAINHDAAERLEVILPPSQTVDTSKT